MSGRTIPSGWWKDTEYARAHFYNEIADGDDLGPSCLPSPIPDHDRDYWLDLVINDPRIEDEGDLPLPGTDMGRARCTACEKCVAKVLP